MIYLHFLFFIFSRSSGPVSFGFQSLENATNANNLKAITSPGSDFPPIAASPDSTHSNISLRNEMGAGGVSLCPTSLSFYPQCFLITLSTGLYRDTMKPCILSKLLKLLLVLNRCELKQAFSCVFRLFIVVILKINTNGDELQFHGKISFCYDSSSTALCISWNSGFKKLKLRTRLPLISN